MNLMTELYKPHRCDYSVELGLTPLYISILFVSFCVLVYGNCAIKLFQGAKDPGINIGKNNLNIEIHIMHFNEKARK